MHTLRYVLFLSLMELLPINVRGQVPIDLSVAKQFRMILSVNVGEDPSAPHVVASPCETVGRDLISVPSMGGGRTFFTLPRIDTSAPPPEGWRSTYMPLDYDGAPPVEYMNQNGRVDACASGVYPFQKTPLDTIQCWEKYISMERSVDVDGDGFLDVVCNTGGNGATAWIILGGPTAGKGCERVLVVPVVKSANKYNQTKAFYQGARGEWRLIQQERDSIDRAPRLQMYRVNFTRTAGKPEVTFTTLGQYRGVDVTQIDEPFGELCVVVDSVNGIDHMLINHRIGPPGSQWALERYDATSGEIISSGEIVSGYNFYGGTYRDFQYDLATTRPVIKISSDKGGLFSYIDDLRQPFALFDPTGTGAQPVQGYSAVNDQSGDGLPDLVVVGGDGIMVVLTLDTVNTSVHMEDASRGSLTIRIVDEVLEVNSTSDGRLTVSIVSLEGKTIKAMPDQDVPVGLTRIPVAHTLQGLSRGQYVLRASINGAVQTLLLVR